MTTTRTPLEYRGWMLAQLDRLMAPGVKLVRKDRDWCVQKRNWLALDDRRGPGESVRNSLIRMLRRYGLEKKPKRIAMTVAWPKNGSAVGADVADYDGWQHRPGAPMPRPPRRAASGV